MTSPIPFLADQFCLSRRAWLGAALLLGASRTVNAARATLPAARSLRDELALALKGGNPLVVLVSLEGCPFCRTAREHYLSPMREQQALPVVQVDMRSPRALRNFTSAAATQDQMVRAWGVTIAPTVLFFGRGGVEVAERLTGGYIPDFYGAYLDERLAHARKALKTS